MSMKNFEEFNGINEDVDIGGSDITPFKPESVYIDPKLEEEAKFKLKQATYWVIGKHGFYGKLLQYAGVYLTATVKPDGTAFTDHKDIYFDPGFVMRQSIGSLKFVLIHEILHIALTHGIRRGHRNPTLWNIAADYAINDLIVLDKFFGASEPDRIEFPTDENGKTFGHHDEKWRGMKAEDIYEILLKNPEEQPEEKGESDIKSDSETRKVETITVKENPDADVDWDNEMDKHDNEFDEDSIDVEDGDPGPGGYPRPGGDDEEGGDPGPGGEIGPITDYEGHDITDPDGEVKGGGEDDDEDGEDGNGTPPEFIVGDFVIDDATNNIHRITKILSNGDVETRPATPGELEKIKSGKNIGL